MPEMPKEKKVLSLGALAMDIVLESDVMPQNDGFAVLKAETLLPGGSASNVSVALHCLGVKVYQTGKIGDDALGLAFKEDLLRQGVNVDFLIVKPGGTTLHTYVITVPQGQHCIFANLGDCVFNLEADELAPSILCGFCCFYTDMFSPRASIHLARKAKEFGVPVVYNMQCVPSFMEYCGVTRPQIEEMISLSTLLLGGRASYAELTGKEDVYEALDTIYRKHRLPDGAICSVGAAGAVWLDRDGLVEEPFFSVNVIDTTGVGDAFAAGLIFERYCRGRNKPETLRFACAAAALKC